jgi:hypothetical protein
LSGSQATGLPRQLSASAVSDPGSKHCLDEVRHPDHRPTYTWAPEPPLRTQPGWENQVPLPGAQPPVTSTGSRPYSSILTPSTVPVSAPPSVSRPSIDLKIINPEHLLNVYIECYEPGFPYIVLPPNITARELKAKKPWLSDTISMVASHGNRTKQLSMAKEIIMEISAALFIRCEKSLDLLEALIVYNIWQYYYAPINPQYQSSAVIQLAVAVLFDLGLNNNMGGPDM